MEEAAHYDSPKKSLPKIKDSKNPLLHVMKQLRNLQFHIITSNLHTPRQVVTCADREFDMPFWYVEDIQESDCARLATAKHYTPADTKRMIAWFNIHQRDWGVGELLHVAVGQYAKELIDAL